MKIPNLRAQVLRKHLYRQSLSQAEFARQAGVSAPYLSLLLCGRRTPGPRVRRRLLAAVEEHGLGYDDLFDAVS